MAANQERNFAREAAALLFVTDSIANRIVNEVILFHRVQKTQQYLGGALVVCTIVSNEGCDGRENERINLRDLE